MRSLGNDMKRAGLGALVTAVTVATSGVVAAPAFASPHGSGPGASLTRTSTPVVAANRAANLGAVPGKVVVHLRPGHTPDEVAAKLGGRVGRTIGGNEYEIEVPAGTTADAAAVGTAPHAVDGADWVEPVERYAAAAEPNDPCYTRGCAGQDEWALRKINAAQAWGVTTGSPAVQVAVLDTGVDASHSELAGKVTVGPNYTTSPSNTGQHGTEVAGVIAATTNNGVFMASLGWQTHIISVKVLDDSGVGDSTTIAQGIRWAADHGAQVINMSLSGPSPSSTMASAVAYAISHNVVVVAAAGNDSSSVPTYPAAYPGVVGVAATDRNDNLASFSNRGPWVTMAAPGEGILTLAPSEQYAVASGTSFASPEVAAAAALVLASRPGASASDVVARITAGADAVASLAGASAFGRLNAGRAVVGGMGGYNAVASDGGLFSFGDAPFLGSMGGTPLNQPIVGMATTPTGGGYWLVARDGGIFAFGNAVFAGSTGGTHLNQPIVGMASTPSGRGYWLVASDGGIFAFGDAVFAGSTGGTHLNQPIVGMASTPSGRGYWLVARDGGIFAFGDAVFHGSTGAIQLNQPIVGMASHGAGGYWLVASDGGIFAFGNAPFLGSAGAIHLNQPIVGMAAAKAGDGYRLIASDGGIFAYGNAPFLGSTGGIHLNRPIVAIATS